MAAMPVYAWDMPPAIVDHAHERLHQHNTFLGVLSRRAPDQLAHPNRPDVDISDTRDHYVIELEIPGISDPSTISIRWTGSHYLVVTGKTPRTSSPVDSKDVAGEREGKEVSTSSHLSRTASHIDDASPLNVLRGPKHEIESSGAGPASDVLFPSWLIVAERRVGSFKREFNFPAEIDMEHLTARLDAGLLRVELPKKIRRACYVTGTAAVEASAVPK